VRKDFVAAMKAKFADLNLTYSIGGQISFDVFPQGKELSVPCSFVSTMPLSIPFDLRDLSAYPILCRPNGFMYVCMSDRLG
jgi:Eukaryotic phosphomannomutase